MPDFKYRELTTRKGKKVVFCNFEELLMNAYGVGTMDEVRGFLNESTGEYICHCPFCKEEGHTKHKLYIKEDLSEGHCFVCCRAFINTDDRVDVTFKVPEFNNFFGWKGFNVVPLTDPVWSLDKFKYEFDDYSEKGVQYLIGRHQFLGELYKVLDFKFWEDNIVMPFKYHGEIFYYQIRFTGDSPIRYFFPPISAKPPYVIDHDVQPSGNKIIISEGVYDAIADLIMFPDHIPFAVLGSSISDYQLEFLREYLPSEILIYMDETSISKRIADRVKQTIDYCPIHIIPSDGEDPEENLKKRIKNGWDLQWKRNDGTGETIKTPNWYRTPSWPGI